MRRRYDVAGAPGVAPGVAGVAGVMRSGGDPPGRTSTAVRRSATITRSYSSKSSCVPPAPRRLVLFAPVLLGLATTRPADRRVSR